ncbi:hypothetical protein ACWEWU_10775 [Staphylococcus xylosus]
MQYVNSLTNKKLKIHLTSGKDITVYNFEYLLIGENNSKIKADELKESCIKFANAHTFVGRDVVNLVYSEIAYLELTT